MCGQCGLILEHTGPIGHLLRVTEGAMLHRGPDSTGFALYGEASDDERIIVRARAADGIDPDEALSCIVGDMKLVDARLEGAPQITEGARDGGTFLRLTVAFEGDPARLLDAVESTEGVSVHSMGRRLEIVKDVGTADEVSARHGVDDFIGTHGMAHSRLATESTVDVELSHPFWARPFLDVAITHNGQLTNYYKMRRLMTERKLTFLTDNDSELIAVYVAEQLSLGSSLHDALERSITALDGVFTYLLSTESAIGCAADRLAIKPLLVSQIDGTTALATEEQALRRVFDVELVTRYVKEGTVVVWDVPAAQPVEAGAR
jgi:hypothetical protein